MRSASATDGMPPHRLPQKAGNQGWPIQVVSARAPNRPVTRVDTENTIKYVHSVIWDKRVMNVLSFVLSDVSYRPVS